MLGPEGVIDLTSVQLPISIPQFASSRAYPKGSCFSYVLCSDDVRFNDSCVDQVLYSAKTGYYLYKVIDTSMLDVDYIKDYYNE